MATDPSVESVRQKQLDDITQCPICTEPCTDPRVLPCIHTFCLTCIEKWGINNVHDGKLACPYCRTEIGIPNEGFSGLPKNLFVGKLLEARKLASALSANETLVCAVCSEDQEKQINEGQKLATAAVYCIECRTNMCQKCLGHHKKFRSSTPHNLVELEKQPTVEELLQKFPESVCDVHPEESLKIYCNDCKMVACTTCYITSHSGHRCADVIQVAEEMRGYIKTDTDGFLGKADDSIELFQQLKAIRKTFGENVGKTEKEIVKKAEELKLTIERQKTKLLGELDSVKSAQEEKMESVRVELERMLLMMASFERYSDELSSKGTACDVATSAKCLHDRAVELMAFDVRKEIDVERFALDVKFVPQVNSEEEAMGNLIGEFRSNAHVDDVDFTPSAKPLHVITGMASGVGGVTSLGEELFVAVEGSKRIDVYDASTFALQRYLSLGGATATCMSSLASCSVYSCIYMSVYNSSSVYRVEVKGCSTVASWSVGSQPYGLSVNSVSNVLVACKGCNKIEEYTRNGRLVREISLQSDVICPVNVVQLSAELFGVTHVGNSTDRYCVLGLDGRIVRSYGGSRGSGAGLLNNPCGLTINARGRVFIADYYNDRIVMLEPSTLVVTELAVEGGVKCPFCVHYDALHGRLLIGERDGKRVVVLGK